jgi:GT2 family glycosyltransferase
MRNIYIVIITYQSDKDILGIFDSIKYETTILENSKLHIIIVNNGSNNRILEIIKNDYRNIKVINNNSNLGYAKAANIGIKYALKNKATDIILINQDVILPKNFLKPVILNSHEIVSPVIRFKRSGEWTYDYGGKIDWKCGRNYHIEESKQLSVISYQFKDIDYVSGCCMRIKSQVFEKIGYFDERFFMYFEDADFCIRAKKEGFRISAERKSVITHNFKEGVDKPFSIQLEMTKSNLIFILKYLKWNIPFGILYMIGLIIMILINKIR